MRITENLQENFPFITVLTYMDLEYVCIIINQDQQVTSLYDYSVLKTDAEKEKFLELGEVWWWESNRKIPLSIFLHNEVKDFKYAIKNFSTKDVKILFGPVVSLDDILVKRVKRKSITVIRKT